MHMQVPVVVEHDASMGHYTATVPGLPGIIVDAESEEEALRMAREAVVFYREEAGEKLT